VALIYQAELTPSKPDVLTGWVPRQPWFDGDAGARVQILGSFRFDDPAGEVGIESFLVRFGAGGPVLHVPLTYRAEPLELGERHVEPVTTMQHSVLGTRWVYDGARDPAYVAALATAVLTGGTEAALLLPDGTALPSRGTVRGTGTQADAVGEPRQLDATEQRPSTVLQTESLVVELRRVIETSEDPDDVAAAHLSGTWAGGDPALLAVVRPIS
jgi:hypothetical protein